jgi:hypothetical protein
LLQQEGFTVTQDEKIFMVTLPLLRDHPVMD